MIQIILTGMDKLNNTRAQFLTLRPRINAAIDLSMRRFGQAAQDRSKSKYLSGRPGLNVISGVLRGSINYQIKGDDNTKTVSIGTNVVYARIHETGGTLMSRRGKSIVIPKRSFLEPAMKEELPFFARALKNTLREVILKGMSGDAE